MQTRGAAKHTRHYVSDTIHYDITSMKWGFIIIGFSDANWANKHGQRQVVVFYDDVHQYPSEL